MNCSNSSRFTEMCNEYFEWRLRESPEFGTSTGHHQYDHLFDDITPRAYLRRKVESQEMLERLNSFSPENLNREERTSLEVMKTEIQAFLDGVDFKGYYFPLTNQGGFAFIVTELLKWMKFNTLEDYQLYLRRLKALPKRMDDQVDIVQEGIQANMTTHKNFSNQVSNQLEDAIKHAEERFLSPFKDPPKDISESALAKLKASVIDVINNAIIPAYTRLRDFDTNIHQNHQRPKISVASLPNGKAFYQQCLNFHLSLNMTPEEVHQTGIQEVDRVLKEMKKIAESEGFENNLAGFMTDLKKRKEFIHTSGDEQMSYVRHLCYETIRPTLGKLFNNIPDIKMNIVPYPPAMAKLFGMGSYFSGTPDGSRPGSFYINTERPEASPIYSLMALCLHEGEPGHHFQSIYSFAQKGLPKFRQHPEGLKYYNVPSRYPIHSAYAEGWGLYSECLGEELGLYDTYSLLGRYIFEFHRAARLVVDTGIHAFDWSREESIKYLTQSNVLDQWLSGNEVDRYTSAPAQACAYKIGELKIWELRKKAEKALGDRWNIADFHQVVLGCGALPLNVLENLVDQHIVDVLKL